MKVLWFDYDGGGPFEDDVKVYALDMRHPEISDVVAVRFAHTGGINLTPEQAKEMARELNYAADVVLAKRKAQASAKREGE